MRLEHDDLRPRKQELLQLARNCRSLSTAEFKTKLDELAKYIVFNLRDHIFKENHILYPTALDAIKGDEAWVKIKKNCDKIGYCTFSPDSALDWTA